MLFILYSEASFFILIFPMDELSTNMIGHLKLFSHDLQAAIYVAL